MSDTIVGIQVTGDTSGLTRELKAAGAAVQQFSGTVGYMFPALKEASAAEKEVTVATKQVSEAVNESVGFFTKLLSVVPAVGAGFQHIGKEALETGVEVQEASAEMVEGLVKVAEAARLAEGHFSFFAAGSALLGAPAILGIISELSERLAESAIHFEHLSGATGVETARLAALSQTMKAAGVENDNVGQAAIRFSRAVETAANGSASHQRALAQLNITSKDFVTALGEAAVHLQNSNNYTQDAANLSILFGRNVQNLIGFLRSSGSELNNLIAEHLEYGEALETAIPASQKLIQEQVHLREQFDLLSFSAFPHIVSGLQAMEREWVYLKELYQVANIYIDAFIEVGRAGLSGLTSIVLNLNSAVLATGLAFGGQFDAAKKATDQAGQYLAQAREQFSALPGIISDANTKAATAMEAGQKQLNELAARNAKKPLGGGERPEDSGIQFGASQQAKEAAANAEVENWQKHQTALINIARETQAEFEKVTITTAQQRMVAAERFAKQELDIAREAVNKKLAIYRASDGAINDPAQYQKLLGERQAADDKYRQDVAKASAKKVEDDKKENDTWDNLIRESGDLQIANIERVAAEEKKMGEADVVRNQNAFNSYADYAQKRAAKDAESALKRQQMDVDADLKTQQAREKGRDIELSEKGFAGNWAARIASAKEYEQRIQADIARVNELSIEEAKAKDAEANREKFNTLESYQQATFVPDDTQTRNAITAATKRMTAAQEEYNTKLAQMQKAQVQALQGAVFGKFNSQFTSFITTVLDGTQSMGQAFKKFTVGILNDLTSALVQMGLKWIETKAIELIGGKTTGSALVLQAAGLAGANAYASTAAIPFVGPELAPAAAATAFAGALAFGAFEQGGVVGNKETFALLHPEEMVLPRNLSTGVQSIINNRSDSNSSSTTGGDNHVHYHAAPGETPSSIAANENAVLNVIRKGMRNGKLSPSGAYARK